MSLKFVKQMEMTMKEQAYTFWTKSKLKEILDELSCEYRSSWTKGKLVSALCEQPVEAVLGTLKSTELKDILEKLGESSSGNKAERKKRLLGLLSDGVKAETKKNKRAKAKKVKPLSPEEVCTLAKKMLGDSGDSLEEEHFWLIKEEVSAVYDDRHGITKIFQHIETGTFIAFCITRFPHGEQWIESEPFIIDSFTEKVSMRIFTYDDGIEFLRMEERHVSAMQNRFSEYLQNDSTKALSLVEVPAGSFMMGALSGDENADEEDERPQHKVTLSRGMLVSQHPCTQKIYEAVMGENPSTFTGGEKPVETVSWCDAVLFCNRLSELEGLEPAYVLPQPFNNDNDWSKKVTWNQDADGYRLPTEAEWEYCARGGESHLYAGSNNIDEVAWHDDNSNDETHLVGQKKANGFGLHDMSGNVYEWVWDSYYREYKSSVKEPIYVESSSSDRTLRGGGYCDATADVRISARLGLDASDRLDFHGFRFVRTL